MTQGLLPCDETLPYRYGPRLAACVMTLCSFPRASYLSIDRACLRIGNEELDRPTLRSSQTRRTQLTSFMLSHTSSPMCRRSNNHVCLQEDHSDRRHAAAVNTGTLARDPDNQLEASLASRYCSRFCKCNSPLY